MREEARRGDELGDVARAYFLDDGALREALKKKWNLDEDGFAKPRVSDGVCKRL